MNQLNKSLPFPSLAEVTCHSDGHSITVLTDEGLCEQCGVRIAFTTRSGGVSVSPYASFNLGDHVHDDPACVEENRRLLMGALGVSEQDMPYLIVPKQVHGDVVLSVDTDVSETKREAHEGADSIVCTRAGIPVLLCFADCVPVLLVAPSGAFAVAHAGWRGAIADIPGKALRQLAREADCDPAECNAYIGPHIGACCYETSQEILDRFVERYGSVCDAGNRHLDLTTAVEASLMDNCATKSRICDTMLCTSCNNDRFFSYRADGGITGRHGAFAYRVKQGATAE